MVGVERAESLDIFVKRAWVPVVAAMSSWLPRWLNWSELALLTGDTGASRGRRLAGRRGLDCRAPAQVFTLAGRQKREGPFLGLSEGMGGRDAGLLGAAMTTSGMPLDLRGVFESLPDAMLIRDAAGEIVLVNA